jgi:hypothetical protein
MLKSAEGNGDHISVKYKVTLVKDVVADYIPGGAGAREVVEEGERVLCRKAQRGYDVKSIDRHSTNCGASGATTWRRVSGIQTIHLSIRDDRLVTFFFVHNNNSVP